MDEQLDMEFWGLPEVILAQYEIFGVKRMFRWQADCLLLGNVMNGENLVFSAPTAAGKSLVAEILILKRVLETKKKAFLIVPFISMAKEKVAHLQTLYRNVDLRVGGFMGSTAAPGGFKNCDIVICTIEKANNIINRLMETNRMNEVGIVVVDEIHLLSDPSRGYLLELLLTKILYHSAKDRADGTFSDNVQIVGMSATLPNLDVVANWLKAQIYRTDYRPVPLTQFMKVGRFIHDASMKVLRTLGDLALTDDTDQVVQVCIETVVEGHSVLVFCPSRDWCEKLAQKISKDFLRIGSAKESSLPKVLIPVREALRRHVDAERLGTIVRELKDSAAGLDAVLRHTVLSGVAFHHAGLTVEERDIIEDGFRGCVIKVLVATSTLSSGVNLPARRVIVRSPFAGGNQLLDSLVYHQMIGRAGRTGVDTVGESILMCKDTEKAAGISLITGGMRPVTSCLKRDGERLSSALKRAILEVVVDGVASTLEELRQYLHCTLLCALVGTDLESGLNRCVDELILAELIRLQKNADGSKADLVPTKFGTAVVTAGLPPDEGASLYSELEKARRGLLLENDLHLLYQVIPLSTVSQIQKLDWFVYRSIWHELPVGMQRVGHAVGIDDGFLFRNLRGFSCNGLQFTEKRMIHVRFYSALALNELANEVPLKEVAEKYGFNRGYLQSLQQSAAAYAGMVSVFCEKLGWNNLELLISQFQSRLHFGVTRELCDLMLVTSLDSRLARGLFDDGIESCSDLASTHPARIEKLIVKSAPFSKGKTVWRQGLGFIPISRAAAIIIQEARAVVERCLGRQMNVRWSADETKSSTDASNHSVLDSVEDDDLVSESVLEQKASVTAENPTGSAEDGNEVDQMNMALMSEQILAAVCMDSVPQEFPTHGKSSKDSNRKPDELCEQASGENIEASHVIEDLGSTWSRLLNDATDVDFSMCSVSKSKAAETKSVPGCRDVGLPCASAIGTPPSDEEVVEKSPINHHTDKNLTKRRKIPSSGHESVISLPISQFPGNDTISETMMQYMLEVDFDIRSQVDASNEPKESGKYFEGKNPLSGIQMPNAGQRTEEEKNPTKTPCGKCVNQAENLELNMGDDSLFSSVSGSMMEKLCEVVDAACDSQLNNPAGNISLNLPVNTPFSRGSFPSSTIPSASQELKDCSKFLLEFEEPFSFFEKENVCPADSANGECQPALAAKTNSENVRKIESDVYELSTLSDSVLQQIITCDEAQERCVRSMKTACLAVGTPDNVKRLRNRSVLIKHSPDAGGTISNKENGIAGAKRDSGARIPRLRKSSEQVKRTSLKRISSSSPIFSPSPEVVNNSAERNRSHRRFRKKRRHGVGEQSTLGKTCSNSEISNEFESNLQILMSAENFSLSIASVDVPIVPGNVAASRQIGKRFRHEMSSVTADKQLVVDLHPGTRKRILGIVFCVDMEERARILDLDACENVESRLVALKKALKRLKEQKSLAVMFDASTKLRVIWKAFCHPSEFPGYGEVSLRVVDPKLAAWYGDTGIGEMDLKSLCTMYLRDDGEILEAREQLDTSEATSAICLAVEEAQLVNKLWKKLKTQIMVTEAKCGFFDVESKALVTTAKLEFNGFGFDIRRCMELRKCLENKREAVTKLAHRSAGRVWNLSSRRAALQVLNEVFSGLQTSEKINLTVNSLEKETLQTLTEYHPLPEYILKWRKIGMALTQFVIPFLSWKNQVRRRGDVVRLNADSTSVHPDWEFFSALGRLSTRDPNLQTIYKDFDAAGDTFSLRSMFVARPKGEAMLVAGDYSQMDLRILAHLAKDVELLGKMNSNCDVLRLVAAGHLKKDPEKVTDEERQATKKVVYGIIYGMGESTLARQMNVTEEHASFLMKSVLDSYPGVRRYMRAQIESVRALGYVTTLSGRKRFLPGILADSVAERGHAERQAVHTAVQGSAADLLKAAMVATDSELCNQFGEDAPRLVMSLHDELIFETDVENLNDTVRCVKLAMESAWKLCTGEGLKVLTPVKISVGDSWGNLKAWTETS